MYDTLKSVLEQELREIHEAGLYKTERIITSAQGPEISVMVSRYLIFVLTII